MIISFSRLHLIHLSIWPSSSYRRAKKDLAEGQSPLQRLEVGLHSGPYLLAYILIHICIIHNKVSTEYCFQILPSSFLKTIHFKMRNSVEKYNIRLFMRNGWNGENLFKYYNNIPSPTSCLIFRIITVNLPVY